MEKNRCKWANNDSLLTEYHDKEWGVPIFDDRLLFEFLNLVGKMKRQLISIEINDLLQQLLLQVQSILTTQFIGMYIGGSIANNNFDQDTSDIDCYVITKTALQENTVHKLEQMHKHLYLTNNTYSKKIEASYIPQNDLLSFNPNNTRPYFNEGQFYLAHYGNNFIIELFVLREKCIKISGPNIKDLIKKISTEDLLQSIKMNLYEYWEPMLNNLLKLKRSDYQIFAIVTMCRTLYSIKTGKIASKTEAAKWVINNYETDWKSLIEQALSRKSGSEFNKLEETQQFIKYVIEICKSKK